MGFYTIDATLPQTVDDSFCAFVWSLVVQQPTVRVGIIPQGAATEVYIATQISAKRKAEAKGEEVVEEQVSTLDVVPDATTRSLHDLKTRYGDGLRIAVDPDTSFAAITGSHLRVSSPLHETMSKVIQILRSLPSSVRWFIRRFNLSLVVENKASASLTLVKRRNTTRRHASTSSNS